MLGIKVNCIRIDFAQIIVCEVLWLDTAIKDLAKVAASDGGKDQRTFNVHCLRPASARRLLAGVGSLLICLCALRVLPDGTFNCLAILRDNGLTDTHRGTR